ncbi:MAG: outer membrane lipoprotein-sorting protein [Ignavibacteriaceae bacterium]|nr:outer membrane lipoprotein-sorting protein [Ignavibacteriaceae bacterium]
MKHFLLLILLISATEVLSQDAEAILQKVDRNLSSENRIFESAMLIHGRRNDRTVTSRTYSVGNKKSFTEYLTPPREQGTKMLKLESQLWIYSPSTDRIIQISGHMLRQSVMGSDLSYVDMMDDRKLTDVYSAIYAGDEIFDDRKVHVLELTAKVTDAAYYKRKMWIDRERFVPLKEELYAKSGQLLKRTTLSEVKQIGGRWFPTKIVFKDMLKEGEGTEFRMSNIKFNQKIPDYIFSKAALKK